MLQAFVEGMKLIENAIEKEKDNRGNMVMFKRYQDEEELIERESNKYCMCTKTDYAGDRDEGYFCETCGKDIDPKYEQEAFTSLYTR